LAGGGVIQGLQEPLGCQVIPAALDRQRPLAGVGEEIVEG